MTASPWGELAVVVRRQGSHVGGLLRALDDARVPRTAPESGVSLAQEPATRPFVLALRWLVASEDERNGLDRVRPHVGSRSSVARGGARPPAHRPHEDGIRGAGARVHGRSHRRGGRAAWKKCETSSTEPRRPRTARCWMRSRSCGGSCRARADWSRRPTRPSIRGASSTPWSPSRAPSRRPAPPPTRRSKPSSRRSMPGNADPGSRRGSAVRPTPSRS